MKDFIKWEGNVEEDYLLRGDGKMIKRIDIEEDV